MIHLPKYLLLPIRKTLTLICIQVALWTDTQIPASGCCAQAGGGRPGLFPALSPGWTHRGPAPTLQVPRPASPYVPVRTALTVPVRTALTQAGAGVVPRVLSCPPSASSACPSSLPGSVAQSGCGREDSHHCFLRFASFFMLVYRRVLQTIAISLLGILDFALGRTLVMSRLY